MKTFLLAVLLAYSAVVAGAPTTYYVRPDGGTAAQCNGKFNARYLPAVPGRPRTAATAPNCAWIHPFVALPPTDYDNHNLPPPRIAGGDTLMISGDAYKIGYDPSYPEMRYCSAGFQSSCNLQPVPSGLDAAHRTRIIGVKGRTVLWGSGGAYKMLNLAGSKNVEVSGLELTDHSGCIVNHCQSGAHCDPAQIDKCIANAPGWGNNGIWLTDVKNVILTDINVHGLAGEGVHGGRITDLTARRVRVWANGFAGWDLDDRNGNSGADTSNHGSLYFDTVTVAWSGCGERYPSGEIFGCWDQNEGGYGDGFGTGPTSGNWTFVNSTFTNNVSDGLDLLYANGTGSIVVRNMTATGSAGNQLKVAGPTTVSNSVFVGACAEPWSTRPTNAERDEGAYHYPDDFRGRYNMELSGNCRASGDAIALSNTPGSKLLFYNNTIAGQSDCLMINTHNTQPGSSLALYNNIFYANNVKDWITFATGGGVRNVCAYYQLDDERKVVHGDHNLVYGARNGDCPTWSTCADPLFAETDPITRLPNWKLRTGSPAAGTGNPKYCASTSWVKSGRCDIGARR